ncbi:MAG: hypothetical protein PUG74_05080 [Prevotellaceae bacterium]|nr:hypothetical protein [Prevotellaceae bacterium]
MQVGKKRRTPIREKIDLDLDKIEQDREKLEQIKLYAYLANGANKVTDGELKEICNNLNYLKYSFGAVAFKNINTDKMIFIFSKKIETRHIKFYDELNAYMLFKMIATTFKDDVEVEYAGEKE